MYSIDLGESLILINISAEKHNPDFVFQFFWSSNLNTYLIVTIVRFFC